MDLMPCVHLPDGLAVPSREQSPPWYGARELWWFLRLRRGNDGNWGSQAVDLSPAQGAIGVGPGNPERSSGGISFEITPGNAQVYVEGQYVGLVSAFSPTSQPLTLAPGRHHVEIRLVGYQTMTFDAEVVAGQVVPYQGTLQR